MSGTADSHWSKISQTYRELAANFETSVQRDREGEKFVRSGPAPGTKVESGGLTLEALRPRNFMHDARLTSTRTPYADLIIREGPAHDLSFMVGQFERTWERLRDAGDRGVEWFVEVVVVLSQLKRNRTVRVSLHRPDAMLPDLSARTLGDHQDAMKDRTRLLGRSVETWEYFLAEEPSRFNDHDISRAAVTKNIQPDGLLRLLKDICTRSGADYTVNGNPIIRVSLESAAGVVLRGSHLDQPLYVDVLMGWLYDIIEFLSGEGREKLWSPRRQMFVPVSREESRKAFRAMGGPL